MADNRKYYYLKLKENFFDSDSIAVSYTHLEAAPHRAGLFGGLRQPGAQLPSAGPVRGCRRCGADPAGDLLQGQEREEIPPGHRVRERPMGHSGRHRPLRRLGLLPERPPHPDGADHLSLIHISGTPACSRPQKDREEH